MSQARRMAQAVLLALSSLLVVVPAAPASASVDVSINFHDVLSPYGDWFDHPRFGLVWAPRYVERGWRPYMDGRWEYTDDDWTWVSDDDWGWVTCHYGRWFLDRDEGWIWIPGDEWAPAWVVWREGDGYIGWAPLPPDVDAFDAAVSIDLDPFAFSFVAGRHLCEPRVARHLVPVARNGFYLSLTRDATHYERRGGEIVNRGIDVREVERFRGRAVPRVALSDVRSPRDVRGVRASHGGLPVFRPRVIAREPERRADQALHSVRDETRQRNLERRQEQERRRFEANERQERQALRRIQQRESARPERAVRQEHQRAEQRRAERLQAEQAAQTTAREQVHDRHEAERRAQAEHEQRERQAFQRRQERERQQRESQVAQQREARPRDQPKRAGSNDKNDKKDREHRR